MSVFQEEPPRLARKYRLLLGAGIIALVVVIIWSMQKRFDQPARPRSETTLLHVTLPPPPPAPPPPAQTPPPMEQRMITQETVDPMEFKPDNSPPTEAPAADAGALGTSIQGDGPADGFGLGANKGGGARIGGAAKRPTGSRWGWYANQVQRNISQALQNNKNTRFADFRIEARIWPDHNGRITRARLAESTGNPALDNAITNEVLAGLILSEPPPAGMPLPIVLRLTARPSSVALSK